ncbi:hypothetical protein QG37_05035 [Candidozyma auris]|nr:hypothetical protein QG37_05035 [[Candida] auris]
MVLISATLSAQQMFKLLFRAHRSDSGKTSVGQGLLHGGSDIVHVSKSAVQLADDLLSGGKHLLDVILGVSFRTQTLLQRVQHLCVLDQLGRIKQVGQLGVLRAQSVQKVGDEDDTTSRVDGLSQRQISLDEQVVEVVVGDTVQQGSLLDHSVNQQVDGGSLVARNSGLDVHRDDGDAIGESLHVLSCGGKLVVVSQVRQGRVVVGGSLSTVPNYHSVLLGLLDGEVSDHGTGGVHHSPDDVGVKRLCSVGSDLQKRLVTDLVNVGLVGVDILLRVLGFVDKVTLDSSLGKDLGQLRQSSVHLGHTSQDRVAGVIEGRREVLESVRVVGVRRVNVALVDQIVEPALVKTGSGKRRVEKHRVVSAFTLVANQRLLIHLDVRGKRSDLTRVERVDVRGNALGQLLGKVHVINTQAVVEPLGLRLNERLGNEPGRVQNVKHSVESLSLSREGGVDVVVFERRDAQGVINLLVKRESGDIHAHDTVFG